MSADYSDRNQNAYAGSRVDGMDSSRMERERIKELIKDLERAERGSGRSREQAAPQNGEALCFNLNIDQNDAAASRRVSLFGMKQQGKPMFSLSSSKESVSAATDTVETGWGARVDISESVEEELAASIAMNFSDGENAYVFGDDVEENLPDNLPRLSIINFAGGGGGATDTGKDEHGSANILTEVDLRKPVVHASAEVVTLINDYIKGIAGLSGHISEKEFLTDRSVNIPKAKIIGGVAYINRPATLHIYYEALNDISENRMAAAKSGLEQICLTSIDTDYVVRALKTLKGISACGEAEMEELIDKTAEKEARLIDIIDGL